MTQRTFYDYDSAKPGEVKMALTKMGYNAAPLGTNMVIT